MTDNEIHTYEPLLGPNYIRLISLEPALDSAEPLRFDFHVVDVKDSDDEYEAISYTWGLPLLTYPVYLTDGTHVKVTKNLDSALRRFRYTTKPRILWADAISINQPDDEEKSKQIPLMSSIFRCATRVLAWVEATTDTTERGLRVLAKLSRLSSSEREHIVEAVSRVDEGPRDWEFCSDDKFCVGQFLTLSWFTRLWIIQEIVMNADIVLFSASAEISWVRFAAALDALRHTQLPTANLVGLDRLDALQAIRKFWQHHSSQPHLETQQDMLALVDKFSAYHCSDVRDHVFALYSMASEMQPVERKPSDYRYPPGRDPPFYEPHDPIYMDIDYSVDVQHTYHEFASACIKSGRGAIVLEAAALRQDRHLPEEWRSWVPDWRIPRGQRLEPGMDLHTSDCELVSPDILRLYSRTFRLAATVVTKTVLGNENSDDSMLSYLSKLTGVYPWRQLEPLLNVLLRPCDAWNVDLSSRLKKCLSNPQTSSAVSAEELQVVAKSIKLSMSDTCFFIAKLNDLQTYLGFGNVRLQVGDELVVMNTPAHMIWRSRSSGKKYAWPCLILRPQGNDGFAHRLIGKAYMYPSNPQARLTDAPNVIHRVESTVIHLV